MAGSTEAEAGVDIKRSSFSVPEADALTGVRNEGVSHRRIPLFPLAQRPRNAPQNQLPRQLERTPQLSVHLLQQLLGLLTRESSRMHHRSNLH